MAQTSMAERLHPHRVAIHHALWAVTTMAYVVAAGFTARNLVEAGIAIFWAFFGIGIGQGAAATVLGLVLREPEDEEGQDGRETSDEPDVPPASRPPWRLPWLAVYVLGTAAGVLVVSAVTVGDLALGGQALAVWALAALIGPLSGICVALIGLVVWLCVIGLIGFGRPMITGRAGGEPVPRGSYVGPFLAVSGLLMLPVALVGVIAYESPYRRDFWPLLGFVRDGVDVTLPIILRVSQVASWWLVGGLVVGFAVHQWARRREPARPSEA